MAPSTAGSGPPGSLTASESLYKNYVYLFLFACENVLLFSASAHGYRCECGVYNAGQHKKALFGALMEDVVIEDVVPATLGHHPSPRVTAARYISSGPGGVVDDSVQEAAQADESANTGRSCRCAGANQRAARANEICDML